MKINIHAGHNPDGKVACGASGFVKESTEARAIVDLAINKLRTLGNTVYNCTVNDGTSQNDVLKKIVAKCNAHSVDLDVSVHLNAATTDSGDGKTKGVEVLIYSEDSKALEYAERVAKAISALGFTNRDVKVRPGLYVLKNTDSPAMLVECFFCDDNDDVDIYRKIGAEGIATAIVAGIIGELPNDLNGDGKVTAEDALEILKQVAGLSTKTGNYTAEDALNVLKTVAGITNNTTNGSGNVSFQPAVNSAAVTYKGLITGNNVNVRSGVSTNSSIVGNANKGDLVVVYETAGNWCRVDTNKWICKDYISSFSDEILGVVTSDNVAIRNDCAVNATILGYVNKNTTVRIWNKDGNWYQIDTGKWINSNYVKLK